MRVRNPGPGVRFGIVLLGAVQPLLQLSPADGVQLSVQDGGGHEAPGVAHGADGCPLLGDEVEFAARIERLLVGAASDEVQAALDFLQAVVAAHHTRLQVGNLI